MLVLLEKPGWCAGGREDTPSPGAHQPAGVADEGGKGPTLPNTHTHTHTHTRWWGPRGLPGQVAGPWEYSWTQSPLCAGAPTGLSAVTVTTKQTSLHGGSSPSNQAQAHWPSPGLQPPHPSGVSVEGLAVFAPLFFPVAVAAVSLPLLRPPALWNGTSLPNSCFSSLGFWFGNGPTYCPGGL